MTDLLPNFVAGRWQAGTGAGTTLRDPVLGTALVRVVLVASHGHVHVVTPDVAQAHTGHGNVMPQSLHGGPGRAGGGAELGGLRALDFYHQRAAIQASAQVLGALGI